MQLRRTTADDPAFRTSCLALDADLRATYGEVQVAYDAFNQIAGLPTVVVAEDANGHTLGAGCWRRFDDTTAEIKRMFVPAEHRGRGIAGAIVAELERWAREHGYRAAVLETGDRQLAAIAMYRRAGYEITAPFGPYAGMPVSVCMRKSLLG